MDKEGKGLLQLILDNERMDNKQGVDVQIENDNQQETIPLTIGKQDEAEDNPPETTEIEETEEDKKKCKLCCCRK